MLVRRGNPLGSHLCRVIAICLLGAVVYSNTLEAPFVFDDIPNISGNHAIRLTELSPQGLRRASFESRLPTRPVANLSFALNYYLGGYRVRGYHLVNLAVHLCNAVLVYLLALILFSRQAEATRQSGGYRPPASAVPAAATLAAMVFVSHPLQTQSVTYVVQRMNSLSAMFFLLALLLYIEARRLTRTRRRLALYGGCLLSWGLALGSKEVAAVFPVIAWLYECYFPGDLRRDRLGRNLRYAPVTVILLFAVTAIYLGANPLAAVSRGYGNYDFTMGERLLTQLRVVVFYISLLAYPSPSRLNLLHDFSTSRSLVDPITTLFSLLALIGLAGLAVALARKQRLISFCIAWFFVTLAIESSLFPLEMVFEHRLYLPMVAVALIVSQVLFSIASQRNGLRLALAGALIVSLGTATYLRNRVWGDAITLWSDVVAKNPRSSRAHNNLGTAFDMAGLPQAAASHYREAIRIDPDAAPAHNNLALDLGSHGHLKRAGAELHKVLAIDPDNAAAHRNLGLALARRGKLVRGKRHLARALRIGPESAATHNDLGRVLAMQGRLDEAVRHYSRALDLSPAFAEAYNNLGEVRARQGMLAEAIRQFSAALRVAPDYAAARRNLDMAYRVLNELPDQRRR